MISFLSAWIFGVAVAASVIVTVLHFLSVRRPPVYALPTARFVVARDVRAVSRSARPSDLLLLALRVLALLAAGAALAGPRWVTQHDSLAYVLVADPSWRTDSASLPNLAGVDVPTSSGRQARDGAVRDGAVRIVWTDSVDGMRTELGAAWPDAWRAAAALLRDDPSLDSVSVHVFAPARGSASYAGWNAWRRTWPGAVQVHVRDGVVKGAGAGTTADAPRTDPRAPNGAVVPVLVREARADDAVRAAFALHTGIAPQSDQVSTTATDAASDAGNVSIEWPASGVPTGWRRTRDTVGALVAGGRAIVAPWIRASVAPDSLPANALVIARWGDGTPAAVEYPHAGGCERKVGVIVPNASDVLNTPAAGNLLRALAAPCGIVAAPVPPSIVRDSAVLLSATPRAFAAAADLRPMLPARAGILPRWLPAALLGISLLLLGVEQLLRNAGSARASELA